MCEKQLFLETPTFSTDIYLFIFGSFEWLFSSGFLLPTSHSLTRKLPMALATVYKELAGMLIE